MPGHKRFMHHPPLPPRPEEEATHGELLDVLMELREKVDRIDEALRRIERR